jgi:hypothetical protein
VLFLYRSREGARRVVVGGRQQSDTGYEFVSMAVASLQATNY